ncbi:MAG: hypothetical protein JSR97_04070 [Verrucomicrobia bacterium]|nr:hypothetical protein [Verrucomicrobiota bacterium]
MQIFSKENILLLSQRAKVLNISGHQRAVKYYGVNIPVLELPDFMPGIIFKLDSSCAIHSDRYQDSIPGRYQAMLQAQKICKEQKFDRLIVPSCALIQIDGLSIAIGAEQKMQLKDKQQTEGLYQGPGLETIAEQLTRFIFSMEGRFSDVKWDNIPLTESAVGLQVALVDLEPSGLEEYHNVKSALCGWNNENGYGQPTPGLVRCLPRYADVIHSTAQQYSSLDFQEDLAAVCNKARKIVERQQNLEAEYQRQGITLATPAISMEWFEAWQPPEDEGIDKNQLRLAVQDINAVVARQGEQQTSLVYAREWRFTMDDYTSDSNKQRNINNNRFIIFLLLEQLENSGTKILAEKEAKDFDVHLRRHVGQYDKIVQFGAPVPS